MLVTGRERRRQDEPARVAARRHAGVLAAHALGRAADPPGRHAGRVELTGRRGTVPVSVSRRPSARREPKRARLNGAVLRSAEQLRGELATLVFTPDRLVVVKGGPAARRAYIDRSLGRLLPGPRARADRLRRRRRPAERRPAPRRGGRLASARCSRRGRPRSPTSARCSTAARRDVIELLQPELRRARRRARPRRRVARLRRRAADDQRSSRQRLDPRSRAGNDRRRARTWTRSGSAAATATSARSARRASSASPCSRSSSPRRS